jgi:hypothetical protein
MPLPTKPAPKTEDLPVVHFLTVVKAGGQWSCVKLSMQGDKVLDRDIIGGGSTHLHAWAAFRAEAARTFYRDV